MGVEDRVNRFLEVFKAELDSKPAPGPDVPRDDVACYYRHFYRGVRPRAMRMFQFRRRIEVALEVLRLEDGIRLFDAGCGVGTSSLLFASLGAKVLGVDSSQAYIRTAKARVAGYEEALGQELDVTFHEGSVLKTEEPVGSFDAVWSMEAISHIYPPQDFVALTSQLLADGGCLVVSDANPVWLQRRRVREKQHGEKFFYVTLSTGEKMPYGNENLLPPHDLAAMGAAAKLKLKCLRFSHFTPSDLASYTGGALLRLADRLLGALPLLRKMGGVYTAVLTRQDRGTDQ